MPEVFSNEDTERVERTPAELSRDPLNAYELMTSLNPRNAEHLNAPLEFMTKKPFEPSEAYTGRPKHSIDVTVRDNGIKHHMPSAYFRASANSKTGYEAHINAYTLYQNSNRGFYATA